MNINWKRLHVPAIALAVALFTGQATPAKAVDFTGIYLAPKFVYGIQVTDGNKQSGTFDYGWKSTNKNVFGGGVSLGYNFDPIFNCPIRVEVEYLAFGNKKSEKSAQFGGELINYSHRLGVQSLMFNAYWDIKTGTRWTPYLGAGLGMGFLSMKVDNHGYDTAGVQNLALSTGYGDRTRFAWNVGAGVAFVVNERLAFDLGYRYADYGRAESKTAVAPASAAYPAGYTLRGKSDVTMHQFLLSARISF